MDTPGTALELPPNQSALLYSMGFVISATGCLHAVGIGIGTCLSMDVGTEVSARCGRRYHNRRAFLYVAGLRMKLTTRVALSVSAVTALLVAVCHSFC